MQMADLRSKFEDDITQAVLTLKKGGIILYPTDTIWGIGCDAKNSAAIKRIFELKRRADSKSMIVLVNNLPALQKIADPPEVAYQLIDSAVNPLTIIYDDPTGVAPELLAQDGSLGIRITGEAFSNELCKRFGGPVVSTSANISGEPSPANFSEISEEIKNGVDYIVNFRQEENNKTQPSNIIKIDSHGVFKILR